MVARLDGQLRRSTEYKISATVGGGAPRHTINVTAGGTTHAASQSMLAPTVTEIPLSAPTPAIATSAAIQTPMAVSLSEGFNM
jgi:hypothetical protein